MKAYDIRSQIRRVAERWRTQYPPRRDAGKDAVYNALKALNSETATAEEVEAIIGNNSWACPQSCDECGSTHDALMQVGQEPDYESATAMICLGCLREAVAKLEAA